MVPVKVRRTIKPCFDLFDLRVNFKISEKVFEEYSHEGRPKLPGIVGV